MFKDSDSWELNKQMSRQETRMVALANKTCMETIMRLNYKVFIRIYPTGISENKLAASKGMTTS